MRPKDREKTSRRYDPEFRIKVVKTSLEQNLKAHEVEQLFGVSDACWYNWKKRYEKSGENGLRDSGVGNKKRRKKISEDLRKQIVEVKQKYPFFGVGRIWHWIRRTFFLPVTRSQIEHTLREQNLLNPIKPRKKYTRKVKRFERSIPNQMWQCDITMFNIAKGLKVYLIGYIDDHSRYMVGWGLYAGQSGPLVLEVLRNAISKYGCPQELLTDNGRQFTSWHGDTDFEKELKQLGIKHIKSRPRHPQTLGKIESFWGHLKREFLRHVVMGGLEDMRARIAHWINYYNFQRPHEGIENATPAEKFFKYSQVAKEEIEKQVRKNEKELAMQEPKSEGPIALVSLGEKKVEVVKQDGQFVVLMDNKPINSNLEKENKNETQETSIGNNSDSGSGSESKSVAGASSSVGREINQPGMQRNGNEIDSVLQTGKQNDPGNAYGSKDAGYQGKAEGPTAGSNEPVSEDRAFKAGEPQDSKPDEGIPQTVKSGEQENAQIRAQEGEKRRIGQTADSGSGAKDSPQNTNSNTGSENIKE